MTEDHNAYTDYCINHVDLSLGFLPPNAPNALELPLWILYFFSPTDTKDDIYKKCQTFNTNFTSMSTTRQKFCALIASHDRNGIRTEMYNALTQIAPISCPAKLLHNDDDLYAKFNDDKYSFLRDCKFNICPENSHTPKYVTEKIFQSIFCGCIPIYWGGLTSEHDSILNKNCYFLWQQNSTNKQLIKEIGMLHKNDNLYKSIIQQNPILVDNATDYVYEKLHTLDTLFTEIIKRKL